MISDVITDLVMRMKPPIEYCNSEAAMEWRIKQAVSMAFGYFISKNFSNFDKW